MKLTSLEVLLQRNFFVLKYLESKENKSMYVQERDQYETSDEN